MAMPTDKPAIMFSASGVLSIRNWTALSRLQPWAWTEPRNIRSRENAVQSYHLAALNLYRRGDPIAAIDYVRGALALIEIAHPDFREPLLEEATRLGYLRSDQTLKSRRDYPAEEERRVALKDGRDVLIRPTRAADVDALQDLFYSLLVVAGQLQR